MSEDQDESSKTEEATSRKLEKAHEEGQFALSREVNHLMSMIGILIIIAWIAPPIASAIKDNVCQNRATPIPPASQAKVRPKIAT